MWTATETEKKLAGVNASDTEYTTRMKVMNLRGELPNDLFTGLPNPKFQKKPEAGFMGTKAGAYPPAIQITPKQALIVSALFVGAGWLVIHLLSGNAPAPAARPYTTSVSKQTAAELKAECDRLATLKRSQGDQAARDYWQACMKDGPKIVTTRIYR